MGSYITTETCIIPGITACFKGLFFMYSKKKEKKQKEKEKKELYNHIDNSIRNSKNRETKPLITKRRSSKILLPPIIKK